MTKKTNIHPHAQLIAKMWQIFIIQVMFFWLLAASKLNDFPVSRLHRCRWLIQLLSSSKWSCHIFSCKELPTPNLHHELNNSDILRPHQDRIQTRSIYVWSQLNISSKTRWTQLTTSSWTRQKILRLHCQINILPKKEKPHKNYIQGHCILLKNLLLQQRIISIFNILYFCTAFLNHSTGLLKGFKATKFITSWTHAHIFHFSFTYVIGRNVIGKRTEEK